MKTIFPLLLFVLALSTGCREIAQSQQSQTNGAIRQTSSAANEVVGKVVGVSDGDTATVLDSENVQHKIRFLGIDAPEKSQAFGQKAKQNLSDLIFGKTVTVKVLKRDKYNREVALVFLDGKDINLQQVKDGFAWHYKDYQREQSADDRKTYADAEDEARRAKRGLWFDAAPKPPWEWRREQKTKRSETEQN